MSGKLRFMCDLRALVRAPSLGAGTRERTVGRKSWRPASTCLESFARSHEMAFVDIRELSRDLAGPNFLPHDGHFSPAGAETMAQLVARYLEDAAGRVR